MKNNIEIKSENGIMEIVSREGKAVELAPLFPKGNEIKGTIGLPSEHLGKSPKSLVKTKDGETDAPLANSYVKIDRENMSIEYVEDSGYPWTNTYIGVLEFDERFKRFTINDGTSYTPFELSELIKMNRSFFETKDKAMKLVSQLRKFKAKVDKQVESEQDERANKKMLYAQAVETNIPEGFKLTLPIFKGEKPEKFEVEISIDANDLSCRLVSPEANDIVESTRDNIITGEIDKIQGLHPELRIFEV